MTTLAAESGIGDRESLFSSLSSVVLRFSASLLDDDEQPKVSTSVVSTILVIDDTDTQTPDSRPS